MMEPETTVIPAAARSLNDICLAAKDRVARQHPRTAVWKANLVIFQPVLVVNPPVAAAVREPGNEMHVAAEVERTRQLTESNFTLAAHDEVYGHGEIRLESKAWVVSHQQRSSLWVLDCGSTPRCVRRFGVGMSSPKARPVRDQSR